MKRTDRISGWHNFPTYVVVKGPLKDFNLKRQARGVTHAEELAEILENYINEQIAITCKDALERYKAKKLTSRADYRQIARFMLKNRPKKKSKKQKDAA